MSGEKMSCLYFMHSFQVQDSGNGCGEEGLAQLAQQLRHQRTIFPFALGQEEERVVIWRFSFPVTGQMTAPAIPFKTRLLICYV
jgi:hypothetical protein